MTAPDLPSMPEGLTPEWLTGALQDSGLLPDGCAVQRAHLEPMGVAGLMSEVARLRLDYRGASGDAPRSLVAKFPTRNPTNREVARVYNLYEREVRYFAELEGLTTAYSPRAYVAELSGDNFVLLLEDLGSYRVGDQVSGANLADSQAAIDELARLHATFWNRTDNLDWVPAVADSYHAQSMQTLFPGGWTKMIELFSAWIPRDIADRGEAFAVALPELQSRMAASPRTLVHGDFRLENLLFGTQPQHRALAIIDWQGPLLGRGAIDVALFLGQSTDTGVRRTAERDLVNRYVAGLRTNGVTGYEELQAWDDYQLALLYSWAYTAVVAGALDGSDERAFGWLSQMVARQIAVTSDRDLFRLLPSKHMPPPTS